MYIIIFILNKKISFYISYKRRGRRGPLPQHWSVLKQYGLGWRFKAGNVVKEEWENIVDRRIFNYIPPI